MRGAWSVENDLKYDRIPKVLENLHKASASQCKIIIIIMFCYTAQIYFLMDLDNLFVIIEILKYVLLF